MRWLVRALAALVAFALGLALVALVVPRLAPVQRWLGEEVAGWTGPSVRIDEATLALLPRPAVRLAGARLLDPRDAAGEPVASTQRIDVVPALGDLLAGRIHARSIAIERLRVRLDPDAEGEYGLVRAIDALGGANEQDDAAAAQPADAASSAEARSLLLPLRAEDVEVQIGGPEGGEPLRVTLRRLTGEIRRNPQDDVLHFDFAGTPADTENVRLDGSWGGRETPRALRADLRLENVRGADLFSHPPGGFTTYDLSASVRGPVGEGPRALDDLRGTGRVRFSGGTIPSVSLGGAIWDALLATVPGAPKTASYARARRPSHIDHLRSDLGLARRVLSFTDLEFVSDDLVIEGKGTLALDGALDSHITVSLTPDGLTELIVMSDLPLPTGPLKKLPPVPMRVRGTIDQPRVRAEVTSLPLHLAGYMVETGVDSVKEAGKAVGKGLRKLLGQ